MSNPTLNKDDLKRKFSEQDTQQNGPSQKIPKISNSKSFDEHLVDEKKFENRDNGTDDKDITTNNNNTEYIGC